MENMNENEETIVESPEVIRERKKAAIQESVHSGTTVKGILDIHPDGYGFIRSDGYASGAQDAYVSVTQIKRFNLRTGDMVSGYIRLPKPGERYSALMLTTAINDMDPNTAKSRKNFEDLTPIFPNERIPLEQEQNSISMRIVDLISPIGKGQRGLIVSPPKSGKTTLLKEVALSVKKSCPEIYLMVLLIDERPEEVTDIKEAITGEHVEVVASTFDELPESHKKLSEMVIERAKRLVEHGKDVMILMDSITRLARAYNLTVTPSGRTLSGGLDPASLYMPKRFFGAARNTRESGSLTILATALVDTGSKMDDVVFEEFKGTGNMELVLNRKMQERRIFPAIDLVKSGTRREDLLLSKDEYAAVDKIRKVLNGYRPDQAIDNLISLFVKTKNNQELISLIQKDGLK